MNAYDYVCTVAEDEEVPTYEPVTLEKSELMAFSAVVGVVQFSLCRELCSSSHHSRSAEGRYK